MLFESGDNQKRVIQEVVYDLAPKHNLKNRLNYTKKFVMMRTMMIGHMEQNQVMVLLGSKYK